MSQDRFLSELDNVRSEFTLRRFFSRLFLLVLGAALFLLGVDLLFSRWVESESWLFWIAASALVFFVLPFLFSIYEMLFRRMSRRQLALSVEEKQPELMDSYVCAVEIAESGRAPGLIESALLDDVSVRYKSAELKKICIPTRFSWAALSTMLVLGGLAVHIMLDTKIVQAAVYHSKDIIAGKSTALEVLPGNVSVAYGEDLQVSCRVVRGRLEGKLEVESNGESRMMPMFRRENSLELTMYGLEKDCRYRVLSPAASSQWYQVKVYLKPELERLSMSVDPPQYTGRKSEQFAELRDLSVPIDSVVKVHFRSNKAITAYLVNDEERRLIQSSDDREFVAQIKVESDQQWQLELVDSEGHTARSGRFKLRALPDLPPHVEISKPAKDVVREPFGTLLVEAIVSDDYGVTSAELHLKFSVAGSEVMVDVLLEDSEKPFESEATASRALDLRKLGVREGDIISYYVVAKDNRQPRAQGARSKTYFLEIRPDLKKMQSDQEGKPNDGQMRVSDLIAEQKRIIRNTMDVTGKVARAASAALGSQADKAKFSELLDKFLEDEDSQKIASDQSSLRVEVQKRLQKAREKGDIGVVGDYLESAISAMKKAETTATSKALESTMENQMEALSLLVKVDIELQKNSVTAKMKKPPKDPPKGQQGDQQQQAQSKKKKKERMADMLDELEELIQKQKELQDKLKQMDASNEQEKKEMEDQLKQQEDELKQLADKMQKMQESSSAGQSTQQAASQMQKAGQQMSQGNQKGSQQKASDAMKQMVKAHKDLKNAARHMMKKELAKLAEKMAKMADQEKQLADKSGSMGRGDKEGQKKAKADQAKLRKEFKQVMDALTSAANEVEEKFPEVAGAIRKAQEFAGRQGIGRNMKKAENALHYGRPGRAKSSQDKASKAMNLLGYMLKNAEKKMPRATLEELLEMRAELEKEMYDLKRQQNGMSASETKANAKRLSQSIGAMGARLNDEKLAVALPSMLDKAQKNSEVSSVEPQFKVLRQAANILDQMIAREDLARRIRANQRTGSPPDKYKRLVRDYFKGLSSQLK